MEGDCLHDELRLSIRILITYDQFTIVAGIFCVGYIDLGNGIFLVQYFISSLFWQIFEFQAPLLDSIAPLL